ncbi:GGDEF domain-containing protein, partial [Thioclava sp. BHET1]
MSMYLWLDARGGVIRAGPTLCKILPEAGQQGISFFDLFRIRRPARVEGMAALSASFGKRLLLQMRDPPETGFRGIAVPLGGDQGALVNLSFGIELTDAVQRHGLRNADFSPTDLSVELLYLAEAKSAVMDQLHDLNRRLQKARLMAEELALTDTLTGLGNRRAMDQVMARLLVGGQAFGLMHLDLDFFKQVNDSYGHAAGDRVLQVIAGILRDETRMGDTVARVGGDEFVLLFPGLAQADRLSCIAQRIIERLSQPIDHEGQICRVGASIGMTVSSRYAEPRADRMLSDADHALYVSKSRGRARATVFDADL